MSVSLVVTLHVQRMLTVIISLVPTPVSATRDIKISLMCVKVNDSDFVNIDMLIIFC